MKFTHHMPAKLFFGRGEIARMASEPMPGEKALIVTTPNKRFLEKVTSAIKTPYVVFSEVQPNPTLGSVMRGAALARESGCDYVIGLGGGSSLDAAKSIAVMMTNSGDYWDYISGGSGLGRPLEKPAAPMIAITTTAGTGTEADPWTVITKEDGGEKIGFGHPSTYPVFSIIDSELMDSVPPQLTAFQGFDALFHSTEGYISNKASAMSDVYCEQVFRLIGENLAAAVNSPTPAARDAVALANTLSGFVESISSCTSEHAIEHALSGFHEELPHGAGLIAISREYYKFFAASEKVDGRLAKMAVLLSQGRTADFVDALTSLQAACGVAALKLSDYGVRREELAEIAQHSFDTMGGLYGNDRAELALADVVGILERSYV